MIAHEQSYRRRDKLNMRVVVSQLDMCVPKVPRRASVFTTTNPNLHRFSQLGYVRTRTVMPCMLNHYRA